MQVVEEVKTQVLEATKGVSFEVNTPADYERAGEVLKQTRKLLRYIDQKEHEITKPLNDGIKKARALFKPWKQKVSEVISALNTNRSNFRRVQEEEAARKQTELDKMTKPDDIFHPVVEPEIPKTNVRTRKVWHYKVTDLSKVDPKFLVIDHATVQGLVTKLHEGAEKIVGGIKAYYTETDY